MKRYTILPAIILLLLCLVTYSVKAQNKNLKLIFVRHAEKPADGDNLSCIGLNRALKLPEVLKAKFGLPAQIYVPALHLGKTTPRARMFQTASPFASKYNLPVNTKFEEEDAKDLADELDGKKGTILIVWEHNYIKPIIKALGIKVKGMDWPDDDYDSIWVVTFKNGEPVLTKDKEGIKPVGNCSL
ncbi:histidine phosphatase family protein [Mucilaginibacter ginsenosidivorax]|uniref:histidine phosphatase family protein n=1 Tax=Mucilaginibacter ginsenosidivorax TaxID=862126 RepID=UPI001CEF7F30|nr:histidine phosphatase family protein [Mucilaginibacter ginsenosidivorax]